MTMLKYKRRGLVFLCALLFLFIFFVGYIILHPKAMEAAPRSTKDGGDMPGVEKMACFGEIVPLPFSELAETSTLVAYGMVTRICDPALVEWVSGGSCHITDVEFSVSDILRGESEKTVTVRTLGGLVNGLYAEYTDVPELIEGQTYLLFLYQPGMGGGMNTEGDYYYLRGLSQGVYLPLPKEASLARSQEDPILVNYEAYLAYAAKFTPLAEEQSLSLSDLERQTDSLPQEVSFSLSQLQNWCGGLNRRCPVDPDYFRRTTLENYRFNVANNMMTQEECDRYTAQLDQYARIVPPEEVVTVTPDPEVEQQKEALRKIAEELQ